jgi:RNA 3'-terminal phosphate cyclase (ATP)
MNDPMVIDGSLGDGGGQVLRTALALSTATGRPFRIDNVRAKREKPGLLRQHLAAVNAAAEVCSATVDGAAIGSSRLAFEPGRVRAGEYRFAVGAAGSTTLVLQTVLPALMLAGGPSTVTLEGGTHTPAAPPFDFLEKALVPLLNRMGPRVAVTLDRAGFHPAGGGRFTARVEPAGPLAPLHLTARAEPTHRLCRAVVAGLSGEIALRELDLVRRMTDWPEPCFDIRQLPDEQGPGNVVTIEVGNGHVTEVFTGFGQRGVRAEAVAEAALQQAKAYLAAGAPVGPHLADQLLVPLALAGGGSFLTVPPTHLTTTTIEIVRAFVDVDVAIREEGKLAWVVEVSGRSGASRR